MYICRTSKGLSWRWRHYCGGWLRYTTMEKGRSSQPVKLYCPQTEVWLRSVGTCIQSHKLNNCNSATEDLLVFVYRSDEYCLTTTLPPKTEDQSFKSVQQYLHISTINLLRGKQRKPCCIYLSPGRYHTIKIITPIN